MLLLSMFFWSVFFGMLVIVYFCYLVPSYGFGFAVLTLCLPVLRLLAGNVVSSRRQTEIDQDSARYCGKEFSWPSEHWRENMLILFQRRLSQILGMIIELFLKTSSLAVNHLDKPKVQTPCGRICLVTTDFHNQQCLDLIDASSQRDTQRSDSTHAT